MACKRKKYIITILAVCILFYGLSFSVFGLGNGIISDTDFPIYSIYDENNIVYGTNNNIYSISRYNNTDQTLIISGVDGSTINNERRMFIPIPLDALQFVKGQTYTFELGCYGVSYNNVDTVIDDFYVNFMDADNGIIAEYGHVGSGNFQISYNIPNNAHHIMISVDAHFIVGQGSNRCRVRLTALHVRVPNNADIGGSFSGPDPELTDIDLQNQIDSINNNSSTLFELVTSAIQNLTVPIQHAAAFFTYFWNRLSVAVPEFVYLITISLVFGLLAMVVNVYSFGKMGGRSNTGEYCNLKSVQRSTDRALKKGGKK